MVRLFFVLLFIFNTLVGQSFITSFFSDGDYGSSYVGSGLYCIQTSDGGYLISGTDNQNLLLLKTSSVGQEEWRVSYGTPEYYEIPTPDLLENNSQYYVSCYVKSFDGTFYKTNLVVNLSGEIIYSTTIEDFVIPNTHYENHLSPIHPENDIPIIHNSQSFQGSYEVSIDGVYYYYGSVGGLYLNDNTNYINLMYSEDGFRLVKGPLSGEVTWDKIFLDSQCIFNFPRFIKEDLNGDILICGECLVEENNSFGFLTKINPEGDVVWSNVYPYNSDGNGQLHYINETSNGNYILGGFQGYCCDEGFNQNIFIVNSEGEIVSYYSTPFNESNFITEGGVHETQDGGFVLTGTYMDYTFNEGIQKIGLMKLDSLGNLNPNDLVDNNLNSCNEISINLNSGWSMLGYCCDEDLNVTESMSEYVESIIIIKDGNGNGYLPEWNFNGIGSFSRGYGYQIKTTQQIDGFSMCNP